GRGEALHRARQLEVEAGPALGSDRFHAGEGAADVDDLVRLRHGVGDGSSTIRRGEVEAVGHGPAPVAIAPQGGETAAEPGETDGVAGGAVAVVTGGVHDGQGGAVVAGSGEQVVEGEGVVGHHVAVAGVGVVAVGRRVQLPCHPPVRLAGVPVADVVDHAGDDGVGGDDGKAGVDQAVEIRFDDRLRLHGGDQVGRGSCRGGDE